MDSSSGGAGGTSECSHVTIQAPVTIQTVPISLHHAVPVSLQFQTVPAPLNLQKLPVALQFQTMPTSSKLETVMGPLQHKMAQAPAQLQMIPGPHETVTAPTQVKAVPELVRHETVPAPAHLETVSQPLHHKPVLDTVQLNMAPEPLRHETVSATVQLEMATKPSYHETLSATGQLQIGPEPRQKSDKAAAEPEAKAELLNKDAVCAPVPHELVPEPALMEVVLSSESVHTDVHGCHKCTVLEKELEESKRDRAFFVDIKRKMILTDTLIQKHQSKCQAFDEQQKTIQNLTVRLAQSKRDCKVLEEQLATTLKDIIPWKKDKERFLQESQETKKKFDEFHNKISAQESLIRQYESKLEVCEEEKAVLESDMLIIKSKIDSMKQSSKKASASLEKTRDDYGKMRKELSQVRKTKASLNMKFERAKTKIKDLCNLLMRHGIKPPRMRVFGSSSDKDEEAEEYMEQTDSSDQDGEGDGSKDTASVKRKTPTSIAKPVTVPPYHPSSLSPPQSVPPSKRQFPKMDFTSVACLSPLPPSPTKNREDKYSSGGDESDTTLAEVAAKIDAQFSTPVLLRCQRDQPNKQQSQAPSIRSSPRQSAKSLTASDDPKCGVDAASRGGSRSSRKVSEKSTGSYIQSARTSFRASKKLELEEPVECVSERKRKRGRPKKHTDSADKCQEDLSQRLQGKVQSLSSSDEEAEKKDGKSHEQNGIPAIRTRSKAKEQFVCGQDMLSSKDTKLCPLSDDLALSSDNLDESDDSHTGSIIGRKKRLNLKRQTFKKSSALSDSSESDDDRKKAKGSDLQQQTDKLSELGSKKSRKFGASVVKVSEGKRLSGESNKTTSDSEMESQTSTRRTSKRLAHRQNSVPGHTTDQNCLQEKKGTKHLRDMSTTAADIDEQALEKSEAGLLGKRVTRQVSQKLLRSLSNPIMTRRSRIAPLEDQSAADGPSQFQRKPGRGLTKGEKVVSKSSSKVDISSKVDVEEVGRDASCQEKALLRNISSPARLTRSASRNLESATECCKLSAEKKSSDEQNIASDKPDPSLPSQEKQSSRTSQTPSSKARRLSQKRTHSDSQSSADEFVVKSLKTADPGGGENKANHTKLSLNADDNDNEEQSARNDAKVLIRSETEEFVACMDDMPSMESTDITASGNQTEETMSAEKDQTIKSTVIDSKNRKSLKSKNKRIKLSSVEIINKKEESLSGNNDVVDEIAVKNKEYSRNKDLDRPSTSRGLEPPALLANQESVRTESPILHPDQRKRHASIGSLPSSGQDSPVSPIQEPFQGFAYTHPISPMSPEEPVERISPILPALFFDLQAIPRMLSPLPPSPRRLHPAEEEAIAPMPEDIQEIMSEEIPEAQAQPRMISPLFPTPVPFAVSPIPEMSVPPAISPISDVQHPPEISPIPEVLQPVLGAQMVPIASPGKSPQLPSPRIFHSVAPVDAITVRPQHSSPGYSQDKTTAIRSLNAVLDGDDNTRDHRSSFSKKLIARRSSAEEPSRKPMDISQTNPPPQSDVRTGVQGINPVNILPHPAKRPSLESGSTDQPSTSTQEQLSNEGAIPQCQSNPKSLGEVQIKDVVPPPLLQNKCGFSEYLRRTKGDEEATAFSRVIPHRDETRNGLEISMQLTGADLVEIPNIAPINQSKMTEESIDGKNVSKAIKQHEIVCESVLDKPAPKLPRKNVVGQIWGEMAHLDRAGKRNRGWKSNQPRRLSLNSQSKTSDSKADAHFKVPSEPPLLSAHTPSHQSVQDPVKVQAPTKGQVPMKVQLPGQHQTVCPRGQVLPGFVPASGSKTPTSTKPQAAIQKNAENVPQPEPGLAEDGHDPTETTNLKDDIQSSNSTAARDHAQTGTRDEISINAQTKTSFRKPSQSRSGPVTADQIKAMKKLHLHDVLRLILEHGPKESVFPIGECIIEFLGQNGVNLFPAIYAKCIVGNTSTEPVISPHEKQISKTIILWTKEKKKKNLMHFLLSELGKRLGEQKDADLNQTLTFARLFAAICRESDWIVRARVICFDVIRERLPNAYHILLAMAAVWPSILKKKDGGVYPALSTMELLVMDHLHTEAQSNIALKRESSEKMMKCFSHLCNWHPIFTESKADTHIHWLIGLLKDPKIAKFQHSKTQFVLGHKCFETIKAIELLASSQGWEWTNNKLIIQQLWPVLKDWSKSLTKNVDEKKEKPGKGSLTEGPHCGASLATACAVMKIIGIVGQIGLVINLFSVEQLMKMLIAVLQQPSQSIPWPMQLYTAGSIYDLSPSNMGMATPVLRQWLAKAFNAVPDKLAESINNLGRKRGSPDMKSCLRDELEDMEES